MLKKILNSVLFFVMAFPVLGQTYHYPALETNNTFTGTNTFGNTTTFNGSVLFPNLTINQCLKLDGLGTLVSTSCVNTPTYSGLAASDGAGNWITPTSTMITSLLGGIPLYQANNLSDVLVPATALANIGGQPLSLLSAVDPPTATCSATVNNKVFVSTINAKLYQCSNNNLSATYMWNNVGASTILPSSPAYSVQFANAGVTGFSSDSQITIDPTTHTFYVGTPIAGYTFTLTPLATMTANWTLDVTSPLAAVTSLGNLPYGQILGPVTTTDCLRWDGTGRITTLACSGAGTVSSVGISVPAQMTVSGTPVTSVGTIALGLNTTGTETKVVTATAPGINGNYAKWNASGGLGDSGIPVPASAGTDYYWTETAVCSPGVGQPVQCSLTTSLPGAMPDANYTIQCTATLYSYSGGQPDGVCALRTLTPLPTASGATFNYSIVQVMQNSTSGGTYSAFFHAHHN